MEDNRKILKLLGISPVLYYYTSLGSLMGILNHNRTKEEGQEICIWASHYKYLNDKTEVLFGRKVVEQMKKEAKMQIKPNDFGNNAFILSFSMCCNSLPMWSMYGKNGDGIMLALDAESIFTLLSPLYKCSYCKSTGVLSERINSVKKDFLKFSSDSSESDSPGDSSKWSILLGILPYLIKSHYFSYEKEVRVVTYNRFGKDTVLYRETNNIIVPYIEKFLPISALKYIMVGPTLNPKLTKDAIVRYLDSCGYDKVGVKVSQIPYRK